MLVEEVVKLIENCLYVIHDRKGVRYDNFGDLNYGEPLARFSISARYYITTLACFDAIVFGTTRV